MSEERSELVQSSNIWATTVHSTTSLHADITSGRIDRYHLKTKYLSTWNAFSQFILFCILGENRQGKLLYFQRPFEIEKINKLSGWQFTNLVLIGGAQELEKLYRWKYACTQNPKCSLFALLWLQPEVFLLMNWLHHAYVEGICWYTLRFYPTITSVGQHRPCSSNLLSIVKSHSSATVSRKHTFALSSLSLYLISDVLRNIFDGKRAQILAGNILTLNLETQVFCCFSH